VKLAEVGAFLAIVTEAFVDPGHGRADKPCLIDAGFHEYVRIRLFYIAVEELNILA